MRIGWKSVLYVAMAAAPVFSCSAQTPHYQQNLTSTANWVVGSSSLKDGAILYTADKIVPYYSNLAAIGLTKNPAYYPQVKAWMQWYISHLNYPDTRWGLYCSMYDYNVSGTPEDPTETATGDADSTDSYAATFLSLAWAFWQTGDADAQAYVKSVATYDLDCIGGILVQTQQSNGLTWAKPDYQIQFLMDNAEVYKGMRDLANLYNALQNTNSRDWYNAHAANVLNGIQTSLWDDTHKNYLTSVGAPPTDWTTWYPDSTAQLFPVLNGILSPSEQRAKNLYATFNAHWPNWTTLEFPDAFPWVLVSGASALMGDKHSVDKYINTIQSKFVSTGFPWPWYSAEAGWFIRVNSYVADKRPLRTNVQSGKSLENNVHQKQAPSL
jgi:hypothetical protein